MQGFLRALRIVQWFIPSLSKLKFDSLQFNAITTTVETETFIQQILFGTELLIYQTNP